MLKKDSEKRGKENCRKACKNDMILAESGEKTAGDLLEFIMNLSRLRQLRPTNSSTKSRSERQAFFNYLPSIAQGW